MATNSNCNDIDYVSFERHRGLTLQIQVNALLTYLNRKSSSKIYLSFSGKFMPEKCFW